MTRHSVGSIFRLCLPALRQGLQAIVNLQKCGIHTPAINHTSSGTAAKTVTRFLKKTITNAFPVFADDFPCF